MNLDGGGSAQILLNNRRSLEISDRNREDHSQAERPIPLGLIVRYSWICSLLSNQTIWLPGAAPAASPILFHMDCLP